MCFLGCLVQNGELMVLAVTLLLLSTAAVTCKGSHCLGKLPWLLEHLLVLGEEGEVPG